MIVRILLDLLSTIYQQKILSNQPFFTPYLLPIKWSFFPSFPTNHENNPAANKAANTPDGKQLIHYINLKFQNKKCYCCDDQHYCGNIVCANWVYFVHYV